MPSTLDPGEGPTLPMPPGAARSAPRRSRLLAELAMWAVAVFVVDQVTKWWAERALTGEAPVPILGDLLQLRLLYNAGAAFSIATGATWLLTVIVIIVIGVVIRISTRLGSRRWAIALGLLLGGAFGNLVDRLFREPGFPQGHVVDFIDYGGLFVGNVADIAIVTSAVAITVLSLRGVGVNGQRWPRHEEPHDPPADG